MTNQEEMKKDEKGSCSSNAPKTGSCGTEAKKEGETMGSCGTAKEKTETGSCGG